MTIHNQKPENNWQQTVLAFRLYLRESVKLLGNKPQTAEDDETVPPNPRKVKSGKPTSVISKAGYQAQFVYLYPAGQQRPVSEPSTTRHFSSPLWVGIGDEERKPKTKAV